MGILESLRLQVFGAAEASGLDPAEETRLVAVGALLVAVAEADGVFTADERAFLLDHLRREGGLDDAAAAATLRAAAAARAERLDLFGFTREVTRDRSYAERLRVAETLCRVATADGRMTHEEEERLRKIVLLLGVTPADYGAIKGTVKAATKPPAL